jgi:cell division transport system permease protein
MKLVGATDWFVRWPFILEGMILGVISALLASGVLLGVGVAFGSGGSLALGVGVRLAVLISLGLILGGAVLGSFGSLVGIRRSLAT